MAAFTTFTEEALNRYITMFGKGEVSSYAPIEGGIENSNYRIVLDQDGIVNHYILTIIEGLDFSEVPFFNKVMTHLYHFGLPVAAPIATLDGMTSTIFCGKPTFLFPKLEGRHLDSTTEIQCESIGAFLASLHQALSELRTERENPYSLPWMKQALKETRHRLSDEHSAQIEVLVDEYSRIVSEDVPRGIIHGDLFKDNALFHDDGTLSGVIDFYHACNDILIQDIAIAINDWCVSGSQISESKKTALLKGYETIRTLTDTESALLTDMQKISAARFALTRLLSGEPPLKDPLAMLDLANSL